MLSLRDIRRRIRSVESTQQITKAMKMVAASRLKRTEATLLAIRPYADGYAQVVSRVAGQLRELRHPLLAIGGQENKKGRIGLMAITADRGLCGGFNTTMSNRILDFLNKHAGGEVSLAIVGRKGRDFLLRRDYRPCVEYVGLMGQYSYALAQAMMKDLLKLREEHKLESIQLLYSRHRSAISQEIVIEPYLPVQVPPQATGQRSGPYIFEPDGETALEAVLEQSLAIQLYRALLETETSVYAARMTAMDNATENAGDLIESLTLSLNRARQAIITTEIVEIMGGADALKT